MIIRILIKRYEHIFDQTLNNPNLTQAEKDKAIALTKDALKDERSANIRKWAIIGGIGLVAIGIVAYMIKRKR